VSHSYLRLFYHFVWTTRDREPLVTPEVEAALYPYLRVRCEEKRVLVHALNGMPDHVHLACTLPTTLCVADFMEMVKGASSHFVNHLPDQPRLYWHRGYGALTFRKRDLPQVVAYIRNQKEHHRAGTVSDEMERWDEEPHG
jgi:putative transposase